LSSGQVEPFAYRVTVTKVVDGDTLDVDIDLGFSMTLVGQRLRLLRVNTPETKGNTREAGMKAKAFTREWLGSHTDIMIRSRKREPGHGEKDSFGRYLVEVYGDNESGKQECLNDDLLDSGNAVPFREDD
jgi:micrococcal nuclease